MNRKRLTLTFFACFSVFLMTAPGHADKTLQVRSPAFKEGGMIPPKFTCVGANVSPPLGWEKAPEGTKSFVLIVDDPDAPKGTFTHWLVYDIPHSVTRIPENVPAGNEILQGGKQGINSASRIGYHGPCPPSGTHRYYFKLYALDTFLNLKPGVDKEELLKAMEGHVLAEGELMGLYKKP